MTRGRQFCRNYQAETAPYVGDGDQALCTTEKHNPLPPMPEWAEAAFERALSLSANQAKD